MTGYTKLCLIRLDTTDKGIFGRLELGDWSCVTLENDEKEIPVGIYPITLYHSPTFGYKVPLLHNVPGRSFIEIHKGNKEEDSKGCILVGTKRTGSFIEGSKLAFDELIKRWPIGEVEIEIK